MIERNKVSLHPPQQGQSDGGLAQLARALAWHARGHRFDSDILHQTSKNGVPQGMPFFIQRFLPPKFGVDNPIDPGAAGNGTPTE